MQNTEPVHARQSLHKHACTPLISALSNQCSSIDHNGHDIHRHTFSSVNTTVVETFDCLRRRSEPARQKHVDTGSSV